MQPVNETGIKEECGVFGIFDSDGGNVSTELCYGLNALQHRGQKFSVYEARLRGGAALARSSPVEADLVAGVPDSGLTASAPA